MRRGDYNMNTVQEFESAISQLLKEELAPFKE
jgi:hypothetical protein